MRSCWAGICPDHVLGRFSGRALESIESTHIVDLESGCLERPCAYVRGEGSISSDAAYG